MSNSNFEAINIFIAVICVITLLALGIGIYTISSRLASTDIEIVQEVKEEVNIEMDDIIEACKLKLEFIVYSILSLVFICISISKRDYVIKDRMMVFKTKSEYVDISIKNNYPLTNIPENYINGDTFIVARDLKKSNIFNYLFNTNENYQELSSYHLPSGKKLLVNGNVEDSGYYYKIDNIYLDKSNYYLSLDKKVNFNIYALYNDINYVNNNIVITKYKVID